LKLLEYAAALEVSRRPGDAAVARYIRTHEAKLKGWVRDFSKGRSKEDREELMQIALLACVEAVRSPDPETAMKNIHNTMQRHSRHAAAWESRRAAALTAEENQ
jgi:DNA-directed RNA polymerase specialized sigma subunit